jgi:hypothetical protein
MPTAIIAIHYSSAAHLIFTIGTPMPANIRKMKPSLSIRKGCPMALCPSFLILGCGWHPEIRIRNSSPVSKGATTRLHESPAIVDIIYVYYCPRRYDRLKNFKPGMKVSLQP